MKKILALTASLVMAVSFVSCGSSGSGKKSSSKSGADKAANDFVESNFSPTGAKTYYTLRFPDEHIKKLKDNDDWEDRINDENEDVEDMLDDYKVNIKSVKKGDELTDDQLMAAEAYFYDYYDCDVTASKGYEYTAKIEIIERDDEDDKETEKYLFCVVELKEGWKVINWSADDLEDEYA